MARFELVHGDFRLENALVVRDGDNRVRVSAVLDFEMVLGVDGAVDLAWLYYRDGQAAPDLAAILAAYGVAAVDRALQQRLLLYQLRYALEHLWWKASFHDAAGMAQVQERIRALLDGALSPSMRLPELDQAAHKAQDLGTMP